MTHFFKKTIFIGLCFLVFFIQCDDEVVKVCSISGLTVESGDCIDEENYYVTIDFDYENTSSDSFSISNRDTIIGKYELNKLPLKIVYKSKQSQTSEFIKVSIDGMAKCESEIEWNRLNCSDDDCGITNLTTDFEVCNDDGTYGLGVNFDFNTSQYSDPTAFKFDVYDRNTHLGQYKLSDLPIYIQNYPFNSQGQGNQGMDYIKIKMADNANCYLEKEWAVPNCSDDDCGITNLTTDFEVCNDNGTYGLGVNFDFNTSQYSDPTAFKFDVYDRNTHLGQYKLSDLPIYIQNYPFNSQGQGNQGMDYIKIKMADNVNCYLEKEWPVPNCSDNVCAITNLTTDFEVCNGDGTYGLGVNFDFNTRQYSDPTIVKFDVYDRNTHLGQYRLSDLPIYIKNYPFNSQGQGNQGMDYIMIKMIDNVNCYLEKEWAVPNCSDDVCEITNLSVSPAGCYNDGSGTYDLIVNFDHTKKASDKFELYNSEEYIGTYYLQDLPLKIKRFNIKPDSNGNIIALVTVSIKGSNGCSKKIEWSIPNCN